VERYIIRLTTFSYIADCIQVYLISDLSKEPSVILIAIWWWKVRERLAVNKQENANI
jgi:hypothetical protein